MTDTTAPNVVKPAILPILSDFTDEDADRWGVDNLALHMRAKLKKKRDDGRGGWHKPEEVSTADLWEMLIDHAHNEQALDVANFAMMIWNRENACHD